MLKTAKRIQHDFPPFIKFASWDGLSIRSHLSSRLTQVMHQNMNLQACLQNVTSQANSAENESKDDIWNESHEKSTTQLLEALRNAA